MNARTCAIAALLVVACRNSERDATVVGNPPDASMEAGDAVSSVAAGDGATARTVTTEEVTITLLGCEDEEVSLTASGGIDLVGLEFELPGGEWCELAVDLPSEVVVEGDGDEGGTFAFTLSPGAITMEASEVLAIDGDAFVLELGSPGWLSAEQLGLQPDEAIEVEVDHPAYPLLSAAFTERSGLYADADADGEVGEEERAAGALASPVSEAVAARFIGLGTTDRRIVSEDAGQSWVWDTVGDDNQSVLYNLAFGTDLFVAVGGSEAQGRIMTTADGAVWTDHDPGTGVLCDVAFGGSRFVAVGLSGVQLWSDDAVVWNDVLPEEAGDYKSVAYGADRFVAVGIGGLLRTMETSAGDDDPSWQVADTTASEGLFDVAFGSDAVAEDRFFVAVGAAGLIATTDDGLSWAEESLGGEDLNGVAYGDGTWVVVGDGRSLVLEDGSWVETAQSWNFSKVSWGGGAFLATTDGAVLSSTDGVSWSETGVDPDPLLVGIGYGGD